MNCKWARATFELYVDARRVHAPTRYSKDAGNISLYEDAAATAASFVDFRYVILFARLSEWV